MSKHKRLKDTGGRQKQPLYEDKVLQDVLSARSELYATLGRKTVEHDMGNYVYHWCINNLETLDFSIKHFWVTKDTYFRLLSGEKLHKGDHIMKEAEMKLYTKQGGEVRDIYCYNKETTKKVSWLAWNIADCYDHQTMHGFAPSRSIFTAWQALIDAAQPDDEVQGCSTLPSVITIDFHSAFEQITERHIYLIFKKIFDLNKGMAASLAHKCCRCKNGSYVGFMGCPIMPIMWNILCMRMHRSIRRTFKSRIQVIQYADDLIIVSRYRYISGSFFRFIVSYISNFWQISKRKCKRHRKYHIQWLGLEATFNKQTGDTTLKPERHHSLEKRLRQWRWKRFRNKELTTARKDRTGKPILVKAVHKGVKEWYLRTKQFSENGELLLNGTY